MKVKLSVTVEVDLDQWSAEYGTEATAADVRQDVRRYFENHIGSASAIEDAGLTVRVA